MAAWTLPRGLVVDLITPLRTDGTIDRQDLQTLLHRALPSAQAVLLAGPQGGEGRHLTTEQREILLKESLSIVRGRVPVFIWVTQETAAATRAGLERLESIVRETDDQAPVCFVDTPLLYHSNRGLPAYYRDWPSRRPVVLFNDPDFAGGQGRPLKRSNIRTHILRELADIDGIVGLFFLGAPERARNYQRAVRRRPDFRLYDGDEASFLTHPSMGGVVSLGANLDPVTWGRVTAASLHPAAGREVVPDSLRQRWQAGQYLRALAETYSGAPVTLIKTLLAQAGVIRHAAPDVADPRAVARLRDLVERYGCGLRPRRKA